MATGMMPSDGKEPPWAPPPRILIPSSSVNKRFSRFRSFSSKLVSPGTPALISEKTISLEQEKDTQLESGKHSVSSLDRTVVEKCQMNLDSQDEQRGQAGDDMNLNTDGVEQISNDDLEDGELPERMELDLVTDAKQGTTGVHDHLDRKDALPSVKQPTFDLVNAAIFETAVDEPGYTLADWHAHITTGKPLVKTAVETKENKIRGKKRRRCGSAKKKSKKPTLDSNKNMSVADKNPAVFKPTVKNTPVGKCPAGLAGKNNSVGKSTAGLTEKNTPVLNCSTGLKNTPVVKSPARLTPSATGLSFSDTAVGEAPTGLTDKNTPVGTTNSKCEEQVPKREITLTEIIEKQLGIWQNPSEQQPTEKKKEKRVLTEARKEKKRANERIKRAQKERAMGIVRRRPVVYKQIEKPPVICKYFLKGRCTKGNDCTFSHEATPETKSYLCKYFLMQCCLKGEDCPFSHETWKFPCKYLVVRGFCMDGDECKFSHAPVSEEEREKVVQRMKKEQEQKTGDGEYLQEDNTDITQDNAGDYDPDFQVPAVDYDPEFPQPEIEYDPIPRDCSWWNAGDPTMLEEHKNLSSEYELADGYDPDIPMEALNGVVEYNPKEEERAKKGKEAEESVFKRAMKMSETLGASSLCSSIARPSAMELLQQTLKESGQFLC